MADADERVVSHYPKRKRTSLFNALSESKTESPKSADSTRQLQHNSSSKSTRNSTSAAKDVILGHWRESPGIDAKTKHAIIGFIDIKNRLRTLIQSISVDGEPIPEEYPVPPGGGCWIEFESVVLSHHLAGLDRDQTKEYVRILSQSEVNPKDKKEREAIGKAAVKEAIRHVANLRQNSHVEARTKNHPLRKPLPEAKARPLVNGVRNFSALDRVASLAKREIARAGAAQECAAQYAAINKRARLHTSEEMQRLGKVWLRQEDLQVKAALEGGKIHGGVKYERKTAGPFIGKLVSQGTILNIDGEDYVEYRILTKPSFF
ncbi:hypothetical protein B0T10DRAFT_593164 [Thelonectria olida]|uniref:Uncharacterized protein n=1 Tax=Thelonectria olida TaxID=1576542 RepID=A0A9P8VRS8_9HYPO|nr:hypothetical protein B0T10DRAFT_593164 [Thelonectria olida]